jgi:hypothetical protein
MRTRFVLLSDDMIANVRIIEGGDKRYTHSSTLAANERICAICIIHN